MSQVTWNQALKIWWSYTWRAMVLTFLVMVPVEGILGWLMFSHLPAAGQKADPQTLMHMFSAFMILWPVIMALMLALQVQAMRWALKEARWSNFSLTIAPKGL